MDAIVIVIAIIFWVISAVSKNAKKSQKRAEEHDPRTTPTYPQNETLRPADIDLPGQQPSMPVIHWDGTVEGSVEPARVIPEPDPAMQPFYRDMAARVTDRMENNAIYEEMQPSPVTIPGLELRLDADALINGIVFTEILNRRTTRRQ